MYDVKDEDLEPVMNEGSSKLLKQFFGFESNNRSEGGGCVEGRGV